MSDQPFQASKWRLILNTPAPGAWNMAVDEAILEAAGGGKVPPTLRLYAWEPPCLSLGYAQPYADVDVAHLNERGWQVVRRPTGGRAILHTDELTYSICGPSSEPRLAGSVLESYRTLSAALMAAMHLMDSPAESQPSAASQSHGPVCFESPSNYEITVAGRKLIGSAQARRKEGVLQHGTLPLQGDLSRIIQVLTFSDENARRIAAEKLHTHAATLEEVTGRVIAWQEAAQAFATAFQETLNLHLTRADLTPAELARAEELMETKYAHADWTQKLG
jgi:lipoyl(octanoyl) transferase